MNASPVFPTGIYGTATGKEGPRWSFLNMQVKFLLLVCVDSEKMCSFASQGTIPDFPPFSLLHWL